MDALNNIMASENARFAVIVAVAIPAVFVLAVFSWEVTCAIDRATRFIINILHVFISWTAYKLAQLLVLAFAAAVVTIMLNPSLLRNKI
jgi:hypothetical protein